MIRPLFRFIKDYVLLMSVNPGFGGQSFIPSTLQKLRAVRERIDRSGRDIRLEIEPGRHFVAPAATLVGRVSDVKKTEKN